ncbi:orotidine-5'-phosphate decarboxylase [Conexibacter sp. S30A1]|uniref:orotidine-5'-phosphate decarboxylase n=1 Tax=Conexibacter sp. S30A1 TaxID=2937800 RepID=UPI00200F9239|nr:orotidine-5'-phosphate decarboxylase [Conexibacter sp. S30A1]
MTVDADGPGEAAVGVFAGAARSAQGFGDRLAEHVVRRQSQLVLGLDPDPALLWPHALELVGGVDDQSAPPAVRAAAAVSAHCRLLIDAVAEHCVAVKPQLACFERLGAPGWSALGGVVSHAKDAGLLVIADAKRGDVDVSAHAYAQAFLGSTPSPFGTIPGLGADAMTVSPWLGMDSLEPFVALARAVGAGLFVLVRNSNPGAAELQDHRLAGSAGTVSDLAARSVARLGASALGAHGLSDVGAVVGATAPQHLDRLRELMPHAVLLLPGVGAQGGRVEDLAAAFALGPAGGLIAVSRALAQAHRRSGGDPAAAARSEAARLREQAWTLAAGAQRAVGPPASVHRSFTPPA